MVSSYKSRLEELRKAKSTTILKREREVLEVNAPDLGRRSSKPSHNQEVEKTAVDRNRIWEQKLQALKDTHVAEQRALREEMTNHVSCNHEEEIKRLKKTLEEMASDKLALRIENEELNERVSSLIQDLSVKEATWCETEERLNLKLKLQWGEKYREWMEATEKKIEDLQQTNASLRGYLQKQKPNDHTQKE